MANPRVECEVDACTHYVKEGHCSAAFVYMWRQREGEAPKTAGETQCRSYHRNKGPDILGFAYNTNIFAMDKDGGFAPSVKCIVSTCQHWENGNYCDAAEIKVGGQSSGGYEDTDCHTFVYSGHRQDAMHSEI